jgi:EAL domain-containing protein (putative c-di-GMP-specific phosphodiesterase class I)
VVHPSAIADHDLGPWDGAEDLRIALEENRLLLYYQPLADLKSGGITGVEALLRWHHPELGWLAPEDVVAVAEHSDQMRRLTAWVMDTALGQLAKWNRGGLRYTMSVNLSIARGRGED